MGKLAELFHFRKEEAKKEKEVRYILTIDGGGMRGIIPARVISHLSQILREAGDERPFYSHFDLIAGTSTGGFLASGLTCPRECTNLDADERDETIIKHTEREKGFFKKPYEVEDGSIRRAPDPEMLEKLYSEEGWRIFQRPSISLFGPIFQDKYDSRNLERFLYDTFGDTDLSELLTPTAIISYETKSGSPYIFRSYDSHSFKLREALRATSAAPTYFAPAVLNDRITGERLVFIDGGVGANNPAMLAYIEARKLYPNADEFRMLSLSTGKAPYSFDPTKTGGGFTGWASSITKVYSTAQETLSEIYAGAMPDLKILRVFSNELERRIALDDVSRDSITMLEDAGEKVFQNQEYELRMFAEDLIAAPTHIDAIKIRRKETPLLSDASPLSSSSGSSNILPD